MQLLKPPPVKKSINWGPIIYLNYWKLPFFRWSIIICSYNSVGVKILLIYSLTHLSVSYLISSLIYYQSEKKNIIRADHKIQDSYLNLEFEIINRVSEYGNSYEVNANWKRIWFWDDLIQKASYLWLQVLFVLVALKPARLFRHCIHLILILYAWSATGLLRCGDIFSLKSY